MGSPVGRSIFRLYMRRVRELSQEGRTLRMREDLPRSLWSEVDDVPQAVSPGRRYREETARGALPWLTQDVSGEALTAAEVARIVRHEFRCPSTPDAAEQADRAVSGLRCLSDQIHLARWSSVSCRGGVEVEVTSAYIGQSSELQDPEVDLRALTQAMHEAAGGEEDDPDFSDADADEVKHGDYARSRADDVIAGIHHAVATEPCSDDDDPALCYLNRVRVCNVG